MSRIIKTAATFTPVTLDEAKLHLRIEADTVEEDTTITALVQAAADEVERATNYCLAQKTYQLFLDAFPCSSYADWLWSHLDGKIGQTDRISLLPAPVTAVSSIKYVDTDGATQTLAAALYSVDLNSIPARVVPAYGEAWPSTREVMNAVTVEYVAGWTLANIGLIPGGFKIAIKWLIAHWYAERQIVTERQRMEIPKGFDNLIWGLRITRF